MEKYIFEGRGYDVALEDVENFLLRFPGAKKYKPQKQKLAKLEGGLEVSSEEKELAEFWKENKKKNEARWKAEDDYLTGNKVGDVVVDLTIGADIFNFFKTGEWEYSGEAPDFYKSAMHAGRVNAELYSPTEKIFDITSTEDARELSDQELNVYIDLMKQSQIATSEMKDLQAFSQSFNKFNAEDDADWFSSTISAVQETGMKGFAQATIQSFRGMMNLGALSDSAPAAATGAGATWYTGYGALVGGMTTGMAALNYNMETIHMFNELLSEELKNRGLEMTPENIRIVMSDDEAASKIKSDAQLRGATIATTEAVFNLVGIKGASTTLKAVKNTKNVVAKNALRATATGSVITTDIAGGGLGEYFGGEIIGRPASGLDVVLESMSGVATTTPNSMAAAQAMNLARSPTYTVDGTRVKKASINHYVDGATTAEQIANLSVRVTNDPDFAAEINTKIINKQIDAQISGEVTDVADRQNLVELEKKRMQAEVDVNKKGSKAVPGAKDILENIELEIAELIGKYAGVDIDADVIARNELGKKVSEKIADKNFKANLKFAKKHSKLYGLSLDDTMTENQIVEKYGEQYKGSNGFIDPDTNSIVINSEVAKRKGIEGGNVANHELLHGIIAASGIKIKKETITNFMNLIGTSNAAVIQKRISENQDVYTTEYMNKNPDEYFTIFSDAIENNDIKFNETIFTKVKDVIRRVFADLGYANVDFNNAQSTYNFLKDYNRSIHKGALSSGLKKATKGVGKVENAKYSISKDQTDSVNELADMGWTNETWKKQGADFAIKEIQSNKMLDGLIRSKYKADIVPNNFVDLVYSELVSHVKNFKPEQNDNLFGWINSQIANKAGNVYNREFKVADEMKGAKDIGKTTKEGDVKVQVAAETDSRMEALETEDMSPAARAKKKADKAKGKQRVESEFRRKIGIETNSDLYNKVLDSSKKALLRAYEAGTSVRNIQRKLRDEANVYLFKSVKNFLGTNDYVKNLKKFREPIVKAIFTADLVQLERNVADGDRVLTTFVEKLTSKQEVQDAVNQKLLPPSALNIIDKGTAVSLYTKKTPTEKQFLDFFYAPLVNPVTGSRSGLRGTRKDGLAKAMAGALSYDATMEVAQEQDVIEKREQLAALKGETLAQDNLETLAAAIGRDPNIKFSNSQYNKSIELSKQSLYDLLINVKDNKGISYRVALKELINNNIYSIKKLKKIPEIQKSLNEQIMFRAKEGLSAKPNSFYLEQHVINNFASLSNNDAFVKLVLDKVAEGVNPDISLEVNGMTLGIEVKADTGRGPARTIYLDIDQIIKGEFTVADGKTSLNPKKLEALIKKTVPGLKKIKDLLSKEFKIKNFDLSSARGKKQTLITEEAWQRIKNQRLDAEVASYVFVDSDFLNYDYLNKEIPSFYINMGNAGLFTTSSFDPLNTGAKNFAGVPVPLTVRLATTKPTSKPGMRRLTLKVETQLDTRAFEKQPVNLFKKKDVEKISKKFSKSNSSGNKTLNKGIKFSRSANNPTKGITVLDFDDTLATSKSLIRFTKPDGTKGTLNAEQYASTYEELSDLGYKFDFSEFSKVVKGKTAPLFNKAMKLQGKFGPKNMFVLTARPAESAVAIHAFLKANGLNIPLKNITGLANSTSEAKALWIADKVGEGYNDFYFADDALQNVQAVKNMLNQFDVKSKVQQARVKFSKSMDSEFNTMLERTTGVPATEIISQARATRRGAKKGKFTLFVPPSAEDFLGLLYSFAGRGKKGNTDLAFFKKSLTDPLNRAYTELDSAKQAIANDYRNLQKDNPEVAKKLGKYALDKDFTVGDAVRVYLWEKSGFEVPGLSTADLTTLTEMVVNDPRLRVFADKLGLISRQEQGYTKPGEHWQAGDIRNDLNDATGKVGRAQFFTEFTENADIIFSQENLQKIESIYGPNFREALENILYRTKTGKNKNMGSGRLESNFTNWVNGSVAATMFVNVRSALLQNLSSVNFINWGDNNPVKAAIAFANQKQYWKDFSMIFNSAKLKQRRSGLGMDINANELTTYMAKSKSSPKALLNWLLQKGFLPTQMADSFAIANGGAAFYRNRVKTYVGQGMDVKKAEEKAWNDFSEISEATQQSARPDMVSQQQASPLGKFILNFQNTPMQYTRLIKKAVIDLAKGRGSVKTNISRIAYYGAVQNMIFYGLQTALFAMMFAGDDEDELVRDKNGVMPKKEGYIRTTKQDKFFQTKKERVANGMLDTILRGTGISGAIIATAKNMLIKFLEQKEKGYNKDESAVLLQFLNFSPVVGIKSQKIVSAQKGYNYNEKVIDHMATFDIDNPVWGSVTSVVEGTTNVPLNRLYKKTMNVRAAMDAENEAWQRLSTLIGFSTWDVGIKNEEIEAIKEELKELNKKTKKKNKKSVFKKFKDKSKKLQ